MKLKGGEILLAEHSKHSYQVVEGTVLYYIVKLTEGNEEGRRFLVAELAAGDCFPMFCHMLGDECFASLAATIDACEFCQISDEQNKVPTEFAKKVDIQPEHSGAVRDELFDELIEQIQKRVVTEQALLYKSNEDRKKTRQEGLEIIYNMFHKPTLNMAANTKSALYNAVAYLCVQDKIEIAEYEVIKSSSGFKFTLDDIANISHFAIREVVLEENWYQTDCGNLLLFSEEGKPLACIQKGTHKHYLYDLEQGERFFVDEEAAQTLRPKGYMLYRPLPNRSLKYKDLVYFGLQNMQVSDVVNLSLFGLFGALIGLLMPVLNQKVFDIFIPAGVMDALWQLGAMMIALAIGDLGFLMIKNLATFRFSSRMQAGVQYALIDRLFNLRQSFYGKYESADLAKRVRDIATVYSMLSDVFLTAVVTAVLSLLYLALMYKYAPKLCFTGGVLILINVLVVAVFGMLQVKFEQQRVEAEGKNMSLLYQLLQAVAKIRIAGVENRALNQYLKPYSKSRSINIKINNYVQMAQAVNMVFTTICSCVFYQKMVVKELGISLGDFLGFTSAFGAFSAGMVGLMTAFLSFNMAIPIFKRVRPVLEEMPEFDETKMVPDTLHGKIEVNNLSFRYTEDGEDVLKNISLCIKSGEYVGIVGSSGSGKSTLLKLLLGFEPPTLGKIYYDDMDLEDLDRRALRRNLGVVLQDGQLFSGSIYENIAITDMGIKPEKVMNIIKKVGLEEDIRAMPMGVHTVVAEGAGTISGGQRQRILIARAILNRPKVIFFDEATSALDNMNQTLVTESIEQLKATRLVIAHRLSTIKECDRIIVLEQGRIVEEGNYNKLMKQQGRFYEMAVRQLVQG